MDMINFTRQDIINFPFPYKLWMIVQLDYCTFIRWNPDGTILLLDLTGLEDYLNSAHSIFKIKNRSAFLQHMDEFQFERLNVTSESGENIIMHFKHIHFQRHRLDLVAKIRRSCYQSQNTGLIHYYNTNGDLLGDELGTMQILSPQVYSKSITESNSKVEHMGDLCFKLHGFISKIQASRMLLQAIISFQNETRILQEKLRIYEGKATHKRRSKGETASSAKINCPTNDTNDESLIDLSDHLFENPYNSTSYFSNSSTAEYAGYYGNCSTEQIMNFFGNYLPRYEEEGTTEVKKIVVDSSAIYENKRLDDQHDQSFVQLFSHVPNDHETVVASPQNLTIQYDAADLSYSPSVEATFEMEKDGQQQSHQCTAEIATTHLKENFLDIEGPLIINEFFNFENSNNQQNQIIIANNSSDINNVNKNNVTSNDIMQNDNAIIESSMAIIHGNDNDNAANASMATVTNNTITHTTAVNTNENVYFVPMSTEVQMDIIDTNVTTQENGSELRSFLDEYRASLEILNDHYSL